MTEKLTREMVERLEVALGEVSFWAITEQEEDAILATLRAAVSYKQALHVTDAANDVWLESRKPADYRTYIDASHADDASLDALLATIEVSEEPK